MNSTNNKTRTDLTINSLKNFIENRTDEATLIKIDSEMNKEDVDNFINSAENIMTDMTNKGYDCKDVFYMLYEILIWNV